MREGECAKCGEIAEKFGGYDPDQGWLCPDCWPSGTQTPSGAPSGETIKRLIREAKVEEVENKEGN
jgi:hypothetical protein